MPELDPLEIIRLQVAQAVAIPLRQVVFTHACAGPYPLETSPNHHPRFRLILPLSGIKRMHAAPEDRAVEVPLRRGQAMVCPPETWASDHWEQRHRVLSIVFYEQYVRYVYFDNCPPAKPIRNRTVYHTPHEAGVVGMNIANALRTLAERPTAQTQTCAIFLVRALLAESLDALRHPSVPMPGKAYRTFSAAKAFLHNHFQEPVNRSSIAQSLALDESYLSRLFVRFAKQNLNVYLNDLRVRHAHELLTETDAPIHQIAKHCGFTNSGYFIRVFKNHFGMPPGKHRTHAINRSLDS